VNKTIQTESVSFTHTYAPSLAIVQPIGHGNMLSIIRPVNRQMFDPNTGIIRQEWEVYFKRVEEALNTIGNQIAQG
jgi:hypothetical protein